MNVWRLITHWQNPLVMLDWAVREGRLAVGWGNIGNIVAAGYNTAQDITKAIQNNYPGGNNAGSGGPTLYHFCYEVKQGDLVILSTGRKRESVMKVTSDYEFNNHQVEQFIGDYFHQRNSQTIDIDPNKLRKMAGGAPVCGHNIRWAFIKCQLPIDHL